MLQTLGIIVLIIVIILLGISKVSSAEKTDAISIKLEVQIKMLSDLGIEMNNDVTVEHLLYSWSREEYENKPFDLILFMYGSDIEQEPWGRKISNSAWNFDVECVEDDGSYINIVKNFALISGNSSRVIDIKDSVNFETGKAWVSYKINGELRQYPVKIDNDWADPNAVAAIMGDMETDNYRFYAKDNGQASIWFYLDESKANALNKLSGNALVSN